MLSVNRWNRQNEGKIFVHCTEKGVVYKADGSGEKTVFSYNWKHPPPINSRTRELSGMFVLSTPRK